MKRRRWLRWLVRGVLGALVLVVVAVGAALIVLHTDWGRDLLRRRIEAALASTFPGGAKIGKLEGSVLGEVTVRDVALKGPDGDISIGTATVDLALWSLVHHTAHVNKLVVDDLAVTLPEQQPPPKPASGGGSQSAPWTIELPDVAIHRARVTRGSIEVTDIDVALGLRAAGKQVEALVSARGAWRGHKIEATAMAAYDGASLSVPFAAISHEDTRVSVIGARVTAEHTLEGAIGGLIGGELASDLGAPRPGDIAFSFDARPGGLGDFHATLGDSELRAFAQVDVADKTVKGVFMLDDPVYGIVVASGFASPSRVRGVVSANIEDANVVAAVDGTLGGGGWIVAGGRRGSARGTVFAHAKRDGDAWQLADAHLVARASELGDARGAFALDLRASGRAYPDTQLRVDGTVDGASVAYNGMSARDVHLRVSDLRDVPAHPVGRISLGVVNARRAGVPLGSVLIAGGLSVDEARTVTIDLDTHEITTAAGAKWAGAGGRIVAGKERVVLRKLHVTGAGGTIDADASIAHAGGDISFDVAAKDISLAALAPDLAGTASGKVSLARRGGRWSGGAQLQGRGVVVRDRTLDGDVDVEVTGRHVVAHAKATSAAGGVALVADVDGPRELTDADAWRALDRRAVHEVSVALDKVDLAAVTRGRATGAVDGELAITATGASGTLHVRGVHTQVGDVVGDLALAPGQGGEVTATATARLADTVGGTAVAQLALPARLSDPQAWRALGRDALRSATVKLDELAFDPDLLARLGVRAPYRGRADATLDIAAGAARVDATAQLHELRGGPLAQPIEVAARTTIDRKGADAGLTASRGSKTLVELTAGSPIAIEAVLDGTLPRAPLTGSVAIPMTQAKDLLAIFGRTDVTAGTLVGDIALAGTIGTPIANATITGKDITVPPRLGSKAPAVLSDVTLAIRWGGASGDLVLTGREAGGGTIKLTADGTPQVLSTLRIALDASKLDLAPLAAFAPGPLVAASGTLDASVEARGLDPRAGDVRGELHLRNARVPLSSAIGTLRRASFDAKISGHTIDAKLAGKLGAGELEASATVALDGAEPSKVDATAKLTKVSPIAAIEPVISGDITGHFERGPKQWTGDISIHHGAIAIPSQSRDALLPTDAPADMTFAGAPPPIQKVKRPAPADPWLVAAVKLGATSIDADNVRDVASGHVVVTGKLTLSVAKDGVGLEGEVDHQRGGVELLGREYQVDHGVIAFDGSFVPLLDVRLLHDFQDVTLVADLKGRATQPDLQLSADPNVYSQDQLLGFFLGGEPGGDPSTASRDAAAGASASFLSTKVGARIKHVLPVKLDVLTYEAGTSTSSGAVRAGLWLSRKLLFQYKGHPEARPDENANEANFEYYLPHNWFLQWTIGDRDIDGADLLHRWRW